VRHALERGPHGLPLRTLAAHAYAVSPTTLTPAQLTGVRQVVTRLKARGEIVDVTGPGGVKRWRTSAVAQEEARRHAEEEARRERERNNQRKRERRQDRGWENWLKRFDPRPAQQEILERAAKLMAMLGSNQPGERDNAARLLEQLRQRHRLDWTDFLLRRK
jgi:hypothetical protein